MTETETETKSITKSVKTKSVKTAGKYTKGKPRKLKSKLGERQFYCVRCRVKRKTRAKVNICARMTTNGRRQLKSSCDGCKKDVYKFASKELYDKYKKC